MVSRGESEENFTAQTSFLWLGPIHSEEVSTHNLAVSPAASSWQREMFQLLERCFGPGKILNFLPERSFPTGPLFSSASSGADQRSIGLSFTNLRLLRQITLWASALPVIYSERRANRVLFTYNAGLAQRLAGHAARLLGAKWVAVIAEGRYSRAADVSIFLSYEYFRRAKLGLGQKLWFAGGVRPLRSSVQEMPPPGPETVLVYAGGDSKWAGLPELIRMFRLLEGAEFEGVRLHIVGVRNLSRVMALVGGDSRVTVFGFLGSSELDSVMMRATAFVNPRPENLSRGITNFPSKVLFYLRYGKPIISTRSPGLGPIFREAFDFYSSREEFNMRVAELKVMSDLTRAEKRKQLGELASFLEWDKVGSYVCEELSARGI